MKRYLALLVTVLVGILSSGALEGVQVLHQFNAPVMCHFPTSQLDFGELDQGQVKQLPITFKNCGNAMMTVKATASHYWPEILHGGASKVVPGSTYRFTVVVHEPWLPQQFPGLYTDTITVATNAGNYYINIVAGHIYGYHNPGDLSTITLLQSSTVATFVPPYNLDVSGSSGSKAEYPLGFSLNAGAGSCAIMLGNQYGNNGTPYVTLDTRSFHANGDNGKFNVIVDYTHARKGMYFIYYILADCTTTSGLHIPSVNMSIIGIVS